MSDSTLRRRLLSIAVLLLIGYGYLLTTTPDEVRESASVAILGVIVVYTLWSALSLWWAEVMA